MLKFDLTRKYLVGFLTVAMVLSLFALPVSAAPGPIVNAVWTVTALPTGITNPTTTITHVIDINTRADGFFADTASVHVAVGFGSVMTSNLPVVRTGTGIYTYTALYGTAPFTSGPGTYTFYAYIDANGNGVFDPADVTSAPATKTWANPAATTFELEYDPTNTIRTTHTITIAVKDQFGGAPFDATPFADITAGPNAAIVPSVVRTSTGVYTAAYVDNFASYANGYIDTIVISVPGIAVTQTITKTWTYTPALSATWTLAQFPLATAFNLVGDTHTVTMSFYDQTGAPISVAYNLSLRADGIVVNSKNGTGTGTAFAYTSAAAGTDLLTITGTIAGILVNFPVGTKVWAGQPGVGPDNAVNALGATHNFVITGIPGETVKFTFTSAGIFSMDDLMLTGAEPFASLVIHTGGITNSWTALPIRASNMDWATIALDATGTATISVMSQAPGKFYMDTYFGPNANAALGRTSTIMIKVSKAYAELHLMDITPTLEINPITQVPTWDVHTVTVVVRGEFPVKPATATIPGLVPPEGGEYVIIGGNQLWAINVPIANINVDWKVQWTDQTVNRVYVSGYDLPAGPIGTKYAPGIAPFWFTAYSTTDANGVASLTYRLDWGGVGIPTVGTCTYYFPCINETITATAGYGNDHLNSQYGIITGTATKEWRDHAFKLVKYNGRLPYGDPNGYIIGAKFFLRRVDLGKTLTTTSPTYVPPMPAGLGWTTPPFAPQTWAPGNAWLVIPSDPAGVVTTATYGEALWMHLPYGVYGLYEYSVPGPFTLMTGELFRFTINATAPYWCGPEPKITTRYQPNGITPTGPSFYKLTWCGTKMTGVQFEVTNLDTPQTISYYTGLNGLLQITLTDFTPAFGSNGTWYKVHEPSTPTLDQWNVVQVPDFYFFISATGGWDDTYYDAIDGNPVWGMTQLPWAFDSTYRHWVVDPKRQSYDLSVFTLTANPTVLQLPGQNTSLLTVKALNQYGLPMDGLVITLTTNFGTLSANLVVTGTTGTATLTIFSDVVGMATVKATSGTFSNTVGITWLSSQSVTPLLLRSGWNLVGVGVGTASTVSALFGPNFQYAFGWDPTLPGPLGGSGSYYVYSNVVPTPGNGFWVKTAATGTVMITGTPVSSPKTLSLAAGWNIIANPFDVVIPWTKVKLNGAAMTPATVVVSYNGTAYQLANFATDSLPIGQGYWIYIASASTLEFSR